MTKMQIERKECANPCCVKISERNKKSEEARASSFSLL
jgi:hypothetical protein